MRAGGELQAQAPAREQREEGHDPIKVPGFQGPANVHLTPLAVFVQLYLCISN